MVILSGCETGLGENTPGEGAMSLQRAFQVAGAHTTVASLWSVPDEKTKELMQQFFHNLWDETHAETRGAPRRSDFCAPRRQSLSGRKSITIGHTIVQRTSRDLATNPTTSGSAMQSNSLPPYYWAAFVLSGDWR